jgi:hypothetical protein
LQIKPAWQAGWHSAGGSVDWACTKDGVDKPITLRIKTTARLERQTALPADLPVIAIQRTAYGAIPAGVKGRRRPTQRGFAQQFAIAAGIVGLARIVGQSPAAEHVIIGVAHLAFSSSF